MGKCTCNSYLCGECNHIYNKESSQVNTVVILPCPFCGVEPEFETGINWATICCINKKCGVQPETIVGSLKRIEQLKQTWNTRSK